MRLTVAQVRNAAGKDKPYKLADGGGLYLLVHPQGRKYWRMNYRYGGKFKTLALGTFPHISLADARRQRDKAKLVLTDGKDPGVVRRVMADNPDLAQENTFQEIAKELLAKQEREGRSDVTMAKKRWLLSFAYPVIGAMAIDQIKAPDLLAVLRTVEKGGRYESAQRLKSTCGQVFRYAIATGRAERDISVDLRGALTAPKVTHRAAIIEPKGAGELLRAIEGFQGEPVTHAALRLAPHVFVRPGELRKAEWAEFDFDAAVWTIPDHKTKMRRPHKVPLTRQALAILKDIHTLTGDGPYVFPSLRTYDRPMSENCINAALRRMGFGKEEMTGHGFRSMASSLLNEMGRWHPDAIERQLGHMDNNNVRRAYARGEYWDERVRMMQVWSDYIDQLRDGAKIITGTFGSRSS